MATIFHFLKIYFDFKIKTFTLKLSLSQTLTKIDCIKSKMFFHICIKEKLFFIMTYLTWHNIINQHIIDIIDFLNFSRYLASRKSARARMNYRIDAASGMICLVLVGVMCGCIASVIDLGATWLSNLKDGICADGFWHSRESCCHHEDQHGYDGNSSTRRHCDSVRIQ